MAEEPTILMSQSEVEAILNKKEKETYKYLYNGQASNSLSNTRILEYLNF